jgi:hypothetical protein
MLALEQSGGGKAGVKAGTLTFQGEYARLAKFERLREGIAAADPDRGVWNCGQSVALIDDVITCREFVERLVLEAFEARAAVEAAFPASHASRL